VANLARVGKRKLRLFKFSENLRPDPAKIEDQLEAL